MASIINASTSAGLVQTADTSGVIALQNNGTTAVTVTGGQVGVGTTTPTSGCLLDVKGGDIRAENTSGSIRLRLVGGSNQYSLETSSSTNALQFIDAAAGAERMRITSGGDLCLGQTTANGRLSILGSNADWNYNSAVTGGATTKLHIRFLGDGAVAGTVTSSGTSTTYGTSSDYRLKEDIAPMTNALNKVSQLKPVTYKWKSDGSESQGFIAHELQEVIPECVVGEKDAVDAEGNSLYQCIDTSFLVATLTAAIQELKAELDATKAEVAALKGTA